jgi:hypothetical protein
MAESSFLREKSASGTGSDVDAIMELLNDRTELPVTKLVDLYLGRVGNAEGITRIEHYLFSGTQIQRNYCTLFFARRNDWDLVNRAFKLGLVDYRQAYSR